MKDELETKLDDRLTLHVRKESQQLPKNLHGNKDSPDLDLVMTESPIPSGHVEFTTTTGSQRADAETEKVYHIKMI